MKDISRNRSKIMSVVGYLIGIFVVVLVMAILYYKMDK